MRVDVKSFIFSLFLLLIILVILFLLNLKFDLVGLTFFINSFYIFFLLIIFNRNRRGINTFSFVLFFYFLFFCIAPWLQYSNKVVIWSPIHFLEDDYLIVNIILFFSFILISFSYWVTRPFEAKGKKKKSENKITLRKGSYVIALVLSIFSLYIIFRSGNYNVMALFVRNNVDVTHELVGLESPQLFILATLSRFLPMFLVLLFIESNNKRRYGYRVVSLFLILLFCSFPTAIPRFFVGFIYIPLLAVLFICLRSSIAMIFLMTFSMFFVFPFLNQFRYFNSIDNLKVVNNNHLGFLVEGHFDAYQNLMSVIKFDLITYGKQLLGALLFFIPRSIWTDKPVGSGYALAEKYNFYFNNISMPYLAEGYINFGLFGIFIFSFILGFLMKKIDTSLLLRSNYPLDYGIGVFCCSALFFLQRGDLMTSISIISACVVSAAIAKSLIK